MLSISPLISVYLSNITKLSYIFLISRSPSDLQLPENECWRSFLCRSSSLCWRKCQVNRSSLHYQFSLKICPEVLDGRVINEQQLALLWRKVVTEVCRNWLIEGKRAKERERERRFGIDPHCTTTPQNSLPTHSWLFYCRATLGLLFHLRSVKAVPRI